jgi:hypothetical protein
LQEQVIFARGADRVERDVEPITQLPQDALGRLIILGSPALAARAVLHRRLRLRLHQCLDARQFPLGTYARARDEGDVA